MQEHEINEIAALMQRAATAEAQAERWQQVSTALADLSTRETAIREAANKTERQARQHAEQVRVEVTTPLVTAAQSALAEWRQAEAAEQTAGEQVRSSSWFGKRHARDEHEEARAHARAVRHQVTGEWGEPPKRSPGSNRPAPNKRPARKRNGQRRSAPAATTTDASTATHIRRAAWRGASSYGQGSKQVFLWGNSPP